MYSNLKLVLLTQHEILMGKTYKFYEFSVTTVQYFRLTQGIHIE